MPVTKESAKSHFCQFRKLFATEIYLTINCGFGQGDFSDFTRTLDMRSGELVRKYNTAKTII